MAVTYTADQYQIPRGRVYFDPFNAADELTGEDPLGNCPGLTLSIETEKAEHYSSQTGLREKDQAVLVQVNRTGKLTCDNVSTANLARFLSGAVSTVTQTSTTVTGEALSVVAGRHYQIGRTTDNPAGARGISSVTVAADAAAWVAATAYAEGDIVRPTSGSDLHYYRCTVAGTSHASTEPTWPTNGSTVTDGTVTWEDAGTLTFVAGTDYNLDAALGRLQILAPVGEVATPIVVGYSRPAKTWSQVKTGAVAELSGALRVIADNASGENRDYYLPRVVLTPSGDLPVIADGTDFVSIEFGIEVLKPANGEAIYLDGRPVA